MDAERHVGRVPEMRLLHATRRPPYSLVRISQIVILIEKMSAASGICCSFVYLVLSILSGAMYMYVPALNNPSD